MFMEILCLIKNAGGIWKWFGSFILNWPSTGKLCTDFFAIEQYDRLMSSDFMIPTITNHTFFGEDFRSRYTIFSSFWTMKKMGYSFLEPSRVLQVHQISCKSWIFFSFFFFFLWWRGGQGGSNVMSSSRGYIIDQLKVQLFLYFSIC